jgi:hypothetical protein
VLILPSPFWFADTVLDLVFVIWGATALQQDFRLVLSRQCDAPSPLPPQLLLPLPTAQRAHRA